MNTRSRGPVSLSPLNDRDLPKQRTNQHKPKLEKTRWCRKGEMATNRFREASLKIAPSPTLGRNVPHLDLNPYSPQQGSPPQGRVGLKRPRRNRRTHLNPIRRSRRLMSPEIRISHTKIRSRGPISLSPLKKPIRIVQLGRVATRAQSGRSAIQTRKLRSITRSEKELAPVFRQSIFMRVVLTS
jgi:hypothetical protein